MKGENVREGRQSRKESKTQLKQELKGLKRTMKVKVIRNTTKINKCINKQTGSNLKRPRPLLKNLETII